MIKREIVIVLSHLPWDFPCDYLRQTSLELSKRAEVIIFDPVYFPSIKKLVFDKEKRRTWLRNFRQVKKEGLINFPLIGYLPFQRCEVIGKINLFLNVLALKLLCLFKFGFKKPIFWALNCDIGLAANQFRWGKKLVYDRVDQPASLDEEANLKLIKMDADLLAVSDIVFVNSPYSLKYVKKFNKNSHLVPCGCSIDLFQDKKVAKLEEIEKIPRPIIGLIGSIDHRLDFKLLYTLIRRKKEWSFVFMGSSFSNDVQQFEKVNLKLHLENLGKLPNVYFLGQKPKSLIPDYIASFDVCLIPYDTSQEFVKGCNPMKLYEYLAMGKPVVSTPIEAVSQYTPVVKIARNAEEFEKAIEEFLKTDYYKRAIAQRKKIAQENSWEEKIEQMWKTMEYDN